MIIIDGKEIRNEQEQVKKNQEDIESITSKLEDDESVINDLVEDVEALKGTVVSAGEGISISEDYEISLIEKVLEEYLKALDAYTSSVNLGPIDDLIYFQKTSSSNFLHSSPPIYHPLSYILVYLSIISCLISSCIFDIVEKGIFIISSPLHIFHNILNNYHIF